MKDNGTGMDGNLRVYYLDGVPAQASARYRVFNALEQLRVAGVGAVLLPQNYDARSAFAASEDREGVLVVHRAPWDERVEALIHAARDRGLKVLYDVDDLVFEPLAIPWIRALARLTDSEVDLYEDGVRRYHRSLKECDGVITTTRSLARFAAAEGLPAFVHRNAVDLRSLDTARAARQAREEKGDIVLYYGAGTATHDVDFQECGPALERLLRRHSNLRLLVQGDVELGHGLDAHAGRVMRWPWMPWPDYFWGLAKADIALAPLELENPFCEGKSELKWFEAGLFGMPAVASATAAFSEVIRHGENGFLARSQGEWYDILDELISDAELRRKVGATVETEVLTDYTPEPMGKRLSQLLSRVARSDDLAALADEVAPEAVSPSKASSGAGETPAMVAPPAGRPQQKLSIGFLMTAPVRGGGGSRIILRMARHLKSFGHDVTLYVEPFEHFKTEQELVHFIQTHFPGEPLPIVMGLENARPSDALIATFWLTAQALRKIEHTRGKFYLVQDFEPFFYAMGEEYLRAEATYGYGFHHISIGPWCAKYLRERYNARADHFDFPLDRSVYYPRPLTGERPRPRVLYFSRPEMSRRCFNLGVEALTHLKARMPEAQISFFGSDHVDHKKVPFPFEDLKNVGDLNRLAELYSSADAALVLSATNTSLVPYEVSACGCPVVDMDLECNQVNYQGSNAMLLAQPDPEALADALYELLDDPDLHASHREAGFRLAETLPTEEQAARRMEEIIFEGLGLAPSRTSMASQASGASQSDDLLLDATWRQEDAILGELLPGKDIVQTFRCTAPGLTAIALKVGLYGKECLCSLEMALFEEDADKPLQRIRQSLQEASDNAWVPFRFPALPDSDGKRYRMVISSPDARPGNAATLYLSRSGKSEGVLQNYGRPGDGALVFQTLVQRPAAPIIRELINPQRAGMYRLADRGSWATGAARVGGPPSAEVAQLREDLRTVRKTLQRVEKRQEDLSRRLTEMHNFFGALRASLPYRAARKAARSLKLFR